VIPTFLMPSSTVACHFVSLTPPKSSRASGRLSFIFGTRMSSKVYAERFEPGRSPDKPMWIAAIYGERH
jgi:hypothetical protein